MERLQDYLGQNVSADFFQGAFSVLDECDSGSMFVVGVSGGVDSMVALCLLSSFLVRRRGRTALSHLIVVHCNHKIRKEADEEECFVQSFLGGDVSYRGFRFRSQKTDEYSLRKWRRSCFESVVASLSGSSCVVVTGHHLDDRIETSLLHLERGCGLLGLANMSVREKRRSAFFSSDQSFEYLVARPLLEYSKQSLVDYASSLGLFYFQDLTNFDHRGGKRSLVRHAIAGPLATSYPDWYDAWKSLYDGLEKLHTGLYECFYLLPLRISKYRSVDRGYRCMLKEGCTYDFSILVSLLRAVGVYYNVTHEGLSDLLQWLRSGGSGYKYYSKVLFVASHGAVYLFIGDVFASDGQPFWQAKPIANPLVISSIKEYSFGDFLVEGSGELLGGLVRFPQEGDVFGSKRLSRYFINHKIPLFWRPYLPVVEKENVIVFVSDVVVVE